MVPKRIVNKRRVNEALHNMQWIADFRGALTSRVLLEYLELFQILDEVVLHQGMPDTHIWRLSASGQYSTNSAYKALFQGATLFDPANRVWKTGPPTNAEFLCGLWSITGAGLLISLLGVGWNTLTIVFYATSTQKLSTIYYSHAYLSDRYGLNCCRRWGFSSSHHCHPKTPLRTGGANPACKFKAKRERGSIL
jgi:hypothetical protein